MLVAAALLLVGAGVNAVGISDRAAREQEGASPPAAAPA